MFEVEKTDVFLKWLRGLNDVRAVARIQIRIDRLPLGNIGDVKAVGEGISEMRIDYGPGYRIYFKRTGKKHCAVAVRRQQVIARRRYKSSKTHGKGFVTWH